MAQEVIPISIFLDAAKLKEHANWMAKTIDCRQIGDWAEVTDPRYGTFHHVVIYDKESDSFFDKIDIEWQPAAFVVVFRKQGDRVEFLLPKERRVLLKDEHGKQGNVFIRNIPQGLVKTWDNETPEQAALREVKEKTGLEPISFMKLGDVYFDAANSQTAMPFFLAEIDADKLQEYIQSLEDFEEINVGEEDWFALEDIPQLKLQCAKTMSGILLATGFLGLWPGTKNGLPSTDLEPRLHQDA